MPLSGRDVWEALVKLGLMGGAYDPLRNRSCLNADRVAGLLNEVLSKQGAEWLPKVTQTEDVMRAWEASTPRENVLRLYKFLNLLGYSVIGIDAAIKRERKKNEIEAVFDFAPKARP
jgi:hypothetical protein